MNLTIDGYEYRTSPAYLVQGVKGHRTPRRAVAGGNGSFIVSNPAQILVDVRDVNNGGCRTVDMYSFFKQMLGSDRLTEKRASKLVNYYLRRPGFEASDWDEWEEIPNIDAVIR